MKVLSIIFGVLMVIFGISCTCTPVATFVAVGYYIAFLILIHGIVGIIRGISEKRFDIFVLFSILSLVLGIVILAVPGIMAAIDGILVYLAAFWFLVQGIVTAYLAIMAKKNGATSGWLFLLIFGIIGIILGIVMIANPGIMLVSIGLMVGIEFIVAGCDLVSIGLFA